MASAWCPTSRVLSPLAGQKAGLGCPGFFVPRPWLLPALALALSLSSFLGQAALNLFLLIQELFMKSLIWFGLVPVSSDMNGPDGQNPPSVLCPLKFSVLPSSSSLSRKPHQDRGP